MSYNPSQLQPMAYPGLQQQQQQPAGNASPPWQNRAPLPQLQQYSQSPQQQQLSDSPMQMQQQGGGMSPQQWQPVSRAGTAGGVGSMGGGPAMGGSPGPGVMQQTYNPVSTPPLGAMSPAQQQQMLMMQQQQQMLMKGGSPGGAGMNGQMVPGGMYGPTGMYNQQQMQQQQMQQQMLQMQQMQQMQRMQQMGMQQSPNKNAVTPTANMPTVGSGWQSSAFACCDDCFVCYSPYACLNGEVQRKISGDGFWTSCLLANFCICFSCIYGASQRKLIRDKYNLPPEPCSDCCIHCWCPWCALCQEARELRIRGGWQTWH